MNKQEYFSDGEIAANQNIKERDYWLNRLSGDLVRCSFPYDRKKKLKRRMNEMKFRFDGQLFNRLIKLANDSDHRLYMILTAALSLLLYKYTGHRDIIVGAPIYRQEGVQGDFINTVLALRNQLQDEMTFKELLLQVRQTIFAAGAHQNYPIKTLVYKLGMSLEGEDFPLFDVALLLENIHERHYINHIKTNILFSFLRNEAAIEAKIEYNMQFYEESTMNQYISHLERLLQRAVTAVDSTLADIDILSTQEKQQLLYDFNNTTADYPSARTKTVHQWFEEQVRQVPQQVALVVTGVKLAALTGDIIQVTYQDLNQRVNRLALLLKNKGVRPGSIVSILMESSIQLVVAVLGVLKAGGAYLPIDSEYPEQRILSILDDSGTSILLTRSDILAKFSYLALRNLPFIRIEPYKTNPRPPIADIDNLPVPNRELINYHRYSQHIGHAMVKNTISLQATRGCPYNCAFCHKIWPKKHVFRSAENLFAEVKALYQKGVTNFSFTDDIFNLKIKNSTRFFEMIVKNRLDVRFFFPNGVRGDILTESYIDLMVAAGTTNIAFALETASPRLQKLIGKNMNLDKFYKNIEYVIKKYPQVILELFTMHGFPSETEAEAMMTLNFIKSLKWIHFPYVFVLKIYPNTDMAKLAVENGISEEAIYRSVDFAFHELPETLPFAKSFSLQYQSEFTSGYFLLKERLLHVLPHQMKICSENELLQKYDSYLPMEIKCFDDIIHYAGISPEELGDAQLKTHHNTTLSELHQWTPAHCPTRTGGQEKTGDPFRILLLDLSQLFTTEKESLLHYQIVEPLGLMYLLTYLEKQLGPQVQGKILKSRIDFDSQQELKTIITDFQPHLIGIRTLSYYKQFFHKTIANIRQWGITVPIISGGPYATSDYKFILQDPNVNLVVMGEGELTFAQLVEKMIAMDKKLPDEKELKKIRGITFIENEHQPQIQEKAREIIALDNLQDEPAHHCPDNPQNLNKSDDLLYLISTSGSTGIPKSVMLEHRNLINLLNFQFSQPSLDFSRVLQFASIGFDVCAQEIFSALLSGGRLYLLPTDMKTDIHGLFDYIRKHGINTLFLPPAFLKFIFSEPEYAVMFPTDVHHIITAGEQPVIGERFREYLQDNRVTLHNHYGPSETHVVSTFTMNPARPIPELPPMGTPIANTRVYLGDENQKPVPKGAVGELYIAGANVARGYLNNPELTAEKFCLRRPGALFEKTAPGPRKNFLLEGTGGLAPLPLKVPSKRIDPSPHSPHSPIYHTGDLARWLPDGTIEFIGREDHQVKIRGFRIELGEIENRLRQKDFIKDAAVVAREDAAGDRYLDAYVVSTGQKTISELRRGLADNLPEYMMPAHFVQVNHIPLTPNGKVDRKRLPDPSIKSGDHYVPPGTEVEKKLVDIWSEILDMEKHTIGVETNFFELGGHSLKATVLMSRIQKVFGVKTSLGEMFRQPTIKGLAHFIGSNRETLPPNIDKNMVLLKKGIGRTIPFYFIHDGTGEVEGYVEFCQRLHQRWECWGIKAEPLQDYTPGNHTIENIANQYIKKIKTLQPHGPYYITGWSFGGTIAFEMVRQLEKMSEPIGFFSMIDTFVYPINIINTTNPGAEVETGEKFTLQSEINWITKYLNNADFKKKAGNLTEIHQVWPFTLTYLEKTNFDIQRLQKIIPENIKPAISRFRELGLKELVYYLNMIRTLDRARAAYSPVEKLETTVHFFGARQSNEKNKDFWKQWNRYCLSPVIYHQVPGDHFSILKWPGNEKFAEKFSTLARISHRKS